MNNDLPKHYSLVKEHPDHFMLHDSRDGKAFPIAKSGIHPAHQLKILRLPKYYGGGSILKMDEGGEREEDEETSTPSAEPAEATSGINTNELVPQYAPQSPQPQGTPSLMLPQDQTTAQPTPTSSQSQFAGIPGMEEAEKGIKESAASREAAAQATTQALQDYQRNVAQENMRQNDNLADINAEQDQLKQNLMDGKIDPNRYYKNMSTGQRIGSAISLILGGIGSGLTHSPNLAFQMMQKAVDTDIEDQKNNLGKTHTLLGLNMQKYHNAQAAEAATRLQYNTIAQTQIQAAQAKATNGVAAAAMHMQMGNLQQQANQYKLMLSKMGAQAQSLGVADKSGEGGIPIGKEPFGLLNDPKYREVRVPLENGKVYQGADKDAATKMRAMEPMYGSVIDSVHKLQDLADSPLSRQAGTPDNLMAHGIMADLSTKMAGLASAGIGSKRISDKEMDAQHDRLQDPTRLDEVLGSVKNDQFFKSLEADREDQRATNLVGYRSHKDMVPSFQPMANKLSRR